MKAIPVLLCCIFLLSGCGPTTINKLEKVDDATVMEPAAILHLVDSNTLFVHSFEEDSHLFFDHSGKLYGKDIYNNKDAGNWDVSEDGELCMRMKSWWYGDLKCYQMLVSGSTYYLTNSSGVLQFKAEQSAGDTQNIFYVVKGKKKSYRRSLRKKNQPLTDTETPAQTISAAPEEMAEESSKSIVEETSTYSESHESDLRSTVKWMARNCPGCNLAEANLNKADLVTANLVGANLRRASLKMANLRRANLEGANLAAADLSYANLPGANLKNTNLSGASLKGANLIRADLTGANLDDADLTDAHLDGVVGLQR